MALRGENGTSAKADANKWFDIHGPVFWPAVVLIAALIIGTLVAGDAAETAFDTARVNITEKNMD